MTIATLQKSWLFNTVGNQDLTKLVTLSSCMELSKGRSIFEIGDPGISMMIVQSGEVRNFLPMASGKEVILADLRSGDIFGEISLLDGRERSASAKTLTNCELLVIHRKDFLPFLKEQPDTCLKLMETLCGRIRMSDERMTDVGFSDIPSRLAKTILRVVSKSSRSRNRISLSQTELAGLIGGTRENVNRCLRNWQDAGIVSMDKGWINIIDPDRLATISNVYAL